MLWLPQGYQPSRAAIDATVAASGSVWGAHGTLLTPSQTVLANDTVSSSGGGWSAARGAQSHSAGQWYLEMKVLSVPPDAIYGLIDGTTATGAGMDVINVPNSIGNDQFNGTVSGSAFAGTNLGTAISTSIGSILGFALDCDANSGAGYSYLALNNVWYLSGDPTTPGTGFVGANFNGTPMFPGVTLNSGGSVQLKTSLASFTYTPPSGFSAWG